MLLYPPFFGETGYVQYCDITNVILSRAEKTVVILPASFLLETHYIYTCRLQKALWRSGVSFICITGAHSYDHNKVVFTRAMIKQTKKTLIKMTFWDSGEVSVSWLYNF